MDFESFDLTGPPAVTDAAPAQQTEGICDVESLKIGNLEKICGTNTGQHGMYEFVFILKKYHFSEDIILNASLTFLFTVYAELSEPGMDLDLIFETNTDTASWDILHSQIECGAIHS